MTDENLIPVLSEIFEIHEEYPTMRFGEIIQNAVDYQYKSNNNNLLDRSSKQILFALSNYHEHIKRKRID